MLSRSIEFLEKARSSIENQNYEDFLLFIGSAEAIADNTDIISDILYIKAKGFFAFKKFSNAVIAIEEALKFVQDMRKKFKLLKAKGLILAYKGNYRESLRLFKELLIKTFDNSLLVEVYIHISWVMLTEYKREPSEAVLSEIKIYLDTAYEKAESLDENLLKKLIFSNYAEYFKFRKDYDMAIEMIEKVIPLSSESWLCEVYHDLAQIYMEQGNSDLMEQYLHEAELLASKYDNDLVVAKVLYTSAIEKMKRGDYIRVMDSLCIAFYSFINCGSYNYAYDCFTKINEASEALKQDCAMTLKEQFKSMFRDTAYTDLI